MTPSNVELLRDQYAVTNERDFERAMSHYADDVVLVIHGEGIRAGTFEGREAVGRWFGEWFSTFDRDARFEIREVAELEDGSLLIAADHHARGRGSGAEVHGTVAWLYRFRDGKIVRVEGNTALQETTPAGALELLRKQVLGSEE